MDRLHVHLRLSELDDERFVEWVYRVALQREPDEDGRESALTRLRERRLSRPGLIAELVGSDDFVETLALADAIAAAARARGTGERLRALTGPPQADERVVELPWVLSRYHLEEHVLDAGYASAHPAYLLALRDLRADRLVVVDHVEPPVVKGLETQRADVRSLPFRNAAFDLAFCVSTLGHVGRDGSVRALGRGGVERALRELRRVLTERGRLLVTVPTGAEEHLGWLVQHGPARWLELFAHAGFHVSEHEVYALGSDGWSTADDDSVAALVHDASGRDVSAVLCAELHVDAEASRSLRERVRGLTHR